MIFKETPLPGVFVIELDRHEDERGWFARSWCRDEFANLGLAAELTQCSLSHNSARGTLRGMHWQTAPHGEAKVVRCVRGVMYDVALDLRCESPTYCHWFGLELKPENGRALYVPEGCAHGFQTLMDDTDVLYQIAGNYHAASGRGARWNDPAFNITWPLENVASLSERDAGYSDFAR
jgi:dTDP-4-dehydrorhamnose 3,5-epimerase